jgi:hypothetical protein
MPAGDERRDDQRRDSEREDRGQRPPADPGDDQRGDVQAHVQACRVGERQLAHHQGQEDDDAHRKRAAAEPRCAVDHL